MFHFKVSNFTRFVNTERKCWKNSKKPIKTEQTRIISTNHYYTSLSTFTLPCFRHLCISDLFNNRRKTSLQTQLNLIPITMLQK